MDAKLLTIGNLLQSLDGHKVFIKHEANLPHGHATFKVTEIYKHQPMGYWSSVGDTCFKTEDVAAVTIHAVEGEEPSIEIVLAAEEN